MDSGTTEVGNTGEVASLERKMIDDLRFELKRISRYPYRGIKESVKIYWSKV